jgi:hypothetical protein
VHQLEADAPLLSGRVRVFNGVENRRQRVGKGEKQKGHLSSLLPNLALPPFGRRRALLAFHLPSCPFFASRSWRPLTGFFF